MRSLCFLSVLLFGGLIGCGGEKTKKGNSSQEPEKVSYKVAYSGETTELLSRCDSAGWPYTVDTVLLDSVIQFDSLNGKEVEWLYVSVEKNKLNQSVSYEVEEFLVIDSIKQTGTYATWADQRDIGQTKYSNAYLLHKIHLSDTSDIITWAITYATLEACPYASGTIIFATIFYKGIATSCTLIGEDMGAGDPPSGMTRVITGNISEEGKISLHLKEISTDSGEEGETQEKTENDFIFLIKSGDVNLAK